MSEPLAHSGRPSLLVAATTAKRAVRPALMWGLLFGLLIANEALTYHTTFPTAASREEFAASFGGNAGLSAVIGPGRQLDTIEGVVAWRMFGLMLIVGAVWGLLTATKLLRGEEDSGRWELLLSGRTSRRHATAQALLGLGVGWLVLWIVTTTITVVVGLRATVGFSVAESMFYALAGSASAAVFLAVGAFTSQLASTRRQANGLAALVFAVAYLTRLLADAGLGLEWLRWASPLGWVENMRPLTDPQPWALLPLLLLVAGLLLATIEISGRRDVGVGLLNRVRVAEPGLDTVTRPDTAWGLAWFLERGVVLAWIVGLGLLALVFGITAGVAADAGFGSNVDETVGRLGGTGSVMEAWVGYEFLYLAAILAFAAATQIGSLREEEADGHLDNLLVRPVARSRWLAGRLSIATILVLSSGLAVGIGGWAGVAGHGIGLTPMLQAGLSTAIPALVVLGLGILLYGILPRIAAPTLYVLVLWSFLVETFGTSLTDNQLILDTSLMTHLGPVPAADLNIPAIIGFVSSAAIAAALGLLAFQHRDLAAA
jgi:polyether ionophore transport system permease protein